MFIALVLSIMSAGKVILISILFFIVVRTFIRMLGNLTALRSILPDYFICLFSLLFSSFYMNLKFSLVFAPVFLSMSVLISIEFFFKKPVSNSFDELIDHIIMTMRTGVGFERATAETVTKSPVWQSLYLMSENENVQKIPMTNGQNRKSLEILKIFMFCRRNPSQSFKILTTLRQTMRLQAGLYRKQETISLQAKAQAIVSAGLFLVLLIAQCTLNPDFKLFLSETVGRAILLLSILMVGGGIILVFRLSRVKGLQI